jgi:outer membrane receptor protein involved in Fe transport
MSKYILLLTVAPLSLSTAALADTATGAASADSASQTAGTPAAPQKEVFSTGVARGRDILDSSISTSSLKESEIEKFGARSMGEMFRNIPGVRVDDTAGEGGASISIRGLPMASTGSKFLQIEEDGLPVLEFGDIMSAGQDIFLRTDLNLSAIEAIRGGSASTFASNSPGGMINLIDKTGDVPGGAVQGTAGLDYGEYRIDADYGAKLSDTLRFHVGGFYREGQGPRNVGYSDAYKGGQIKFNITKEFTGGYVRLYGKYLDDHAPAYEQVPVLITGTNANPIYSNLPNFNTAKDAFQSQYYGPNTVLNGQNQPQSDSMRDGMHPLVKSVGLEAQFTFGAWTVTDKFRFSNTSGSFVAPFSFATGPAGAIASMFAGPGATLSYGTGPNAGQAIADPTTLAGNGLLVAQYVFDFRLNNLNDIVNDLRTNRVWQLGHGELTTTAGFYKSRQTINMDILFGGAFEDVMGGGNGQLINLTTANGIPLSQNGYFGYGSANIGGTWHRSYDVNYDTNAPYGSVNYHIGRLALGASVRYDLGHAGGTLYGSDLNNGGVGMGSYNFLGLPYLTPSEYMVSVLPLGNPGPVDYSYHYLSYSTGINYRIAEPLSVFARYSKGGRANADRILFGSAVSGTTGALVQPAYAIDFVKQAEAGVKYRTPWLTLNLTGFFATATEHNLPATDQGYRAYGLEFEGAVHKGHFALNVGGTYTHSRITSDAFTPADVGMTPHQQPTLIYSIMPQYEVGKFAIGADITGQTSSYAADTDQLKLPGYTVTNAFLQVRPVERLLLAVNVNNLFDVRGFTEAYAATMPAGGATTARAINGRTVSASVRVDF